jgi:uncharacterized protein (DUF4415 family)
VEKEADIRRYSAAELREKHARGESQTDWARVRAMTDEEIEQKGLEQLEEDGIPADWYLTAVAVRPDAKKLISLRLDSDVVEWFRSQGPGYQTRINAVLRAFMKHAK